MGSFKVIANGNDFDDNEKSEERKLNLGKNRKKHNDTITHLNS